MNFNSVQFISYHFKAPFVRIVIEILSINHYIIYLLIIKIITFSITYICIGNISNKPE